MGWMVPAPICCAARQSAEVIFRKDRSLSMEATPVGLDPGKDVFQVHGVTADGMVVFNHSIRRRQSLKFFETSPSCLVATEACGPTHHWAREYRALEHDVGLLPATPTLKPHVKRRKQRQTRLMPDDQRGRYATDHAVRVSDVEGTTISSDP